MKICFIVPAHCASPKRWGCTPGRWGWPRLPVTLHQPSITLLSLPPRVGWHKILRGYGTPSWRFIFNTFDDRGNLNLSWFCLTWPWAWAWWPVWWEALRVPGLCRGKGEDFYLACTRLTQLCQRHSGINRLNWIGCMRRPCEVSWRLWPHVTSVWRWILISLVPISKPSATAGVSRRAWFWTQTCKVQFSQSAKPMYSSILRITGKYIREILIFQKYLYVHTHYTLCSQKGILTEKDRV